jgi:hypothetical protein
MLDVVPAKAGTQYSRASETYHNHCGVLGCLPTRA